MNEPLAIELIKIAQSQIGVMEVGDNQGPEILKYMRSTWMPEESNEIGYAWCAAFVCWCMTQAVQKFNKLDPKEFIYLGANAYGWEKFAKNNAWEILDETQLALPGDIVTYDFSHIGIVIEDKRSYIEVVEGNTNADGSREGDGVYLKQRAKHLVRKFLRY
jgi:hypothetical protein